MKNLTIAFLAAVSLMSFAGCKKKGGGDMVGKYTELKDQMCKCTDKACADKVVADMAKMAEASAKEAKAPDPEEAKKYEPIMKQYTECMTKALGGGNMMAPPPGDKPAGDKPAAAPAGDKPADPAAAAPPAGDKPADPAAAPPAGDKPAGDKPAGAN
ncbi:MAG TPA: hypothetical protein VHN14_01965 [Kofleriaceae bacterium]|jgi:hypothetical protein|nr:hypothetical protein [Kofleriaceae bacterium]